MKCTRTRIVFVVSGQHSFNGNFNWWNRLTFSTISVLLWCFYVCVRTIFDYNVRWRRGSVVYGPTFIEKVNDGTFALKCDSIKISVFIGSAVVFVVAVVAAVVMIRWIKWTTIYIRNACVCTRERVSFSADDLYCQWMGACTVAH